MPSSSEENSDIAANMSYKERALSIWVVTCGIGRTSATWVLSTAIMALRLVWWTSSDHSEEFKILVVGHFIEFSQVAIPCDPLNPTLLIFFLYTSIPTMRIVGSISLDP